MLIKKYDDEDRGFNVIEEAKDEQMEYMVVVVIFILSILCVRLFFKKG